MIEDAFRKAAAHLVFVARTSGGTAGRDEELCKACDVVESLLTTQPAAAPVEKLYMAPIHLIGSVGEARVRFVSRQHIKDKPIEANPSPIRVLLVYELQKFGEGNPHISPPAPPSAESRVVPDEVMQALDRMCTPLHSSRVEGMSATMQADARCMKVIRDYIIGLSAASPQPVSAQGTEGDLHTAYKQTKAEILREWRKPPQPQAAPVTDSLEQPYADRIVPSIAATSVAILPEPDTKEEVRRLREALDALFWRYDELVKDPNASAWRLETDIRRLRSLRGAVKP